MKALILQHEDSTPPGSTLEWLKQKNITCEVLQVPQAPSLPAMDSFDLLVICGGSMNVDQEATFPWLKVEKEFIRRAIETQKKIVGLCLGSQLLSEVLGGQVQKHSVCEVGWQKVQLIESKKELTVFQWHAYSFSIPPKAERTASSEACKNQAFRLGKNILAYQFHPETTNEWAMECALDPALPAPAQWVQTPEEIKRDLKYQPKLQDWYFAQLDSLL